MDTFRTDRLIARRIGMEHLPELARFYADTRVMATLGGVRSEEETRTSLAVMLDHWQVHGFGIWMMFEAKSGQFVGRGGLRKVNIDGQPEVEVSYAVAAEHWGEGLATEMAQAYVDIAFTKLDLDNVVTFTLPTNRGSRRVMEKCGFHYERDIIHAELPHVFYRLRRPG